MLRPLWDNVWGVALYERPYREEATIETPFARQRRKLENIVLVKEVGKDCRELKAGDLVLLPEAHGGNIVRIDREGEVEYRFCFSEKVALAVWEGGLPEYTTEAGVINI